MLAAPTNTAEIRMTGQKLGTAHLQLFSQHLSTVAGGLDGEGSEYARSTLADIVESGRCASALAPNIRITIVIDHAAAPPEANIGAADPRAALTLETQSICHRDSQCPPVTARAGRALAQSPDWLRMNR